MRIVVAHSRYLSGDASGENRVVDDEVALLRGAGHTVRAWQPSAREAGGLRLVQQGFDAVWSTSAATSIRKEIRRTLPDVVHVHNLYPALSPSVIRAAAAESVPVVMTLHNYRMLCLPATFLRDGKICEDCLGRLPWRGVVHACYRGSHLASGVIASSLALHRAVGSLDLVTSFLAVGDFVKRKHVEAGWEPERIRVKSNFVGKGERRSGPGAGFLYLGRLSPEKGLDRLLRVWPSDVPLDVVGDGPERASLEQRAPGSVTFRGAVPAVDVGGWIAQARALVLPSVCYEGQPRSILEAFSAGVPVIASELGGMPDLVEDGVTGFLVPVEAGDGWVRALDALGDDRTSSAMGEAAHRSWEARFSPERGLAELEAAYDDAASRPRATTGR